MYYPDLILLFPLGDEFHNAVAKDKDNVDLLIMIGSSLKVRPVALIPSSIDTSVPQVNIHNFNKKKWEVIEFVLFTFEKKNFELFSSRF